MRQDSAAGLALVSGSLAGLATMLLHPTGHDLMRDFQRVAATNRAVHALAIAGAIATMYGLVGLSRLFKDRRSTVDAGLICYALGSVAVVLAAVASGFVGTELTARVLQGGASANDAYAPVLYYNWVLNQAYTKLFAVTASVGILLLSLAMIREPLFGRALGLAGIALGGTAAAATLAGLSMDIHGFGAIVLAHGIWLVWSGVKLLQRRTSA